MPTVRRDMEDGRFWHEHQCETVSPLMLMEISDGYGEAIDEVVFNPKVGEWVAGNGEYGSVVGYCPWCGEKLEKVR